MKTVRKQRAEQEHCSSITVCGAKTNNLKSVDVDISHGQITAVTGVSGAGKSSLVLDTVYSEGSRRYVQSMSMYARQFLERRSQPPVDFISGLLPAIAITPINPTVNARSTVGTVTEISDLLRLLFARAGSYRCPDCGCELEKYSPESASLKILKDFCGLSMLIMFPFGADTDFSSSEDFSRAMDSLRAAGFRRLLVGGELIVFDRAAGDGELFGRLKKNEDKKRVMVVVDRLRIDAGRKKSLVSSVKTAMSAGSGCFCVCLMDGSSISPDISFFFDRYKCDSCGVVVAPLSEHELSFNSPAGACELCRGFGRTIEIDPDRVIPDPSKTLRQGALAPWNSPKARRFFYKFKKIADMYDIDLDCPYEKLPDSKKKIIMDGAKGFPGVNGFFKKLEKKIYKVHVRVFLSRYRRYVTCPSCNGSRLGRRALNVYIGGRNIAELSCLSVSGLAEFIAGVDFGPERRKVGAVVLREISRRLETLITMGVGYLTLDRLSRTLSGGEAQRINLACALGGELVDTLFVLEEPGTGLHPVDVKRLEKMLAELAQNGNTLCLITHNRELIGGCENIIDMGPLAGDKGGEVVFSGPVDDLCKSRGSLTAEYLCNEKTVSQLGRKKRSESKLWLEVKGARENNLANLDVRLPLGRMVAVTGVSGAGKSSFAQTVLFRAVCRKMGIALKEEPGAHDSISGFESLEDAVMIDTSPIGRSVRSTPGTYLKIFDEIRKVFAGLPQAVKFGFKPGSFSFNSGAGRCPECEGLGVISVEMQFLADVSYTCPHCRGTRYKSEVLRVKYKDLSISDILNTTADELMILFSEYPPVIRRLEKMVGAGLGYMRLGQATSTMSGGELQRLKTAFFLARGKSNCLYVFDEPGAGLHFEDLRKLLLCFDGLIDAGNSVVVIEHNMDIVAASDYVLDFGPGAGPDGGKLIASGRPEELAKIKNSATGNALARVIGRRRSAKKQGGKAK